MSKERTDTSHKSTESTRVPVLALMKSKMAEMTPVQQGIARFIIEQPERAFKMSMNELARATGTKSESTLVRFYRLLGFSRYHDFKVTLATEIAGSSMYKAYEDFSAEDDTASVLRKFFTGATNTFQENLKVIDPETLQQAVEALERAGRIILIGFAASAAVAHDAYFKFTALGLNCHFNTDPHATVAAINDPRPGDVLFCVSYGGESRDVVMAASLAKPRATVIALTGAPDSPLGQTADICLHTVSEELNYRFDAILTRLVQYGVVGVLFVELAVRQGDEGIDRLRRMRQSLSHLKY